MKQQRIKQIILIFGVIAVLLFFGLASEGKLGIGIFNNTSKTEVSTIAGDPLTQVMSNLTHPAETTITSEDLERIPKVEGTVQSNGNGNSSEYEQAVLDSFLLATEQFTGAGKGMETYKIETYDLLTDADFAEPAFLGREKGVKAYVVYNSSTGVMENTNWGHLTDSSAIAHEIFNSKEGQNTGYVTVSYSFAEKEPRFQVSLTAEDAEGFSDQWTTDTYLPLSAWTTSAIDSSAGIIPYENMDDAISSPRIFGNSQTDTVPSQEITNEYHLYISKNDMKELLGKYSIEMQNNIQTISGYSADSDFKNMAEASKQMTIHAAEIEEEFTHLPINPLYYEVAENFLEGIQNYRYAGTYFWYGATFTEIDPIKTGNTYVQQGFSKNNDALKALDMEIIQKETFEVPNGKLFPNAIYIYENYEYPDKYKRNDISLKLCSLTCTNAFTLKQDDNKEKNVAGYGYKYVFPVVEIHHLGYRGSGSSKITTPDTDDFTIVYNGEEYQSITPSPYVDRKLDPSTFIDPAGYPYYKKTMDRKEEFEGVLVFKVPQDFDPAKAYMTVDLGEEEAVWHMVPR